MGYICNPLNINYRYQFAPDRMTKEITVAREAADPSMIRFHGKYYIFASMTLGVWRSDDLVNWEFFHLPESLPLYDYAPDVRVIGDYVYFSASRRGEICDFYRTKDIENGPFERFEGTFDFWDPNLFCDDDGKIYFYWGCANTTPIWGVQLDPETMRPMGERIPLIKGDPWHYGYERVGEDHCEAPATDEEIEAAFQQFLKDRGMSEADVPAEHASMMKGLFSKMPFIEGAWMTKHDGRYYLQYACPGTEYNIYADGVYVSDAPLGSFEPAVNNPFSYKPGGFIPGAGHGSTMWDDRENLWHISTMRISKNQLFERRIGMWPAGFDADGELFCNQRYGDWPIQITGEVQDPWKDPEWYLLSYGKKVEASSSAEGKNPQSVSDENIQTWWQADSSQPGEWLVMDMGKVFDVHAVQINFADDKIDIPVPGEIHGGMQNRYIDEKLGKTRWILEGSEDGETFVTLEDKSQAETDLPHDLVIVENGMSLRYIKLTIYEVPYGQKPCISGLRVFGIGDGRKPAVPEFSAVRTGDLDMTVEIIKDAGDYVGYNILWGHQPDKLYHSCMTFDSKRSIGALAAGRHYYVRVDAFNENGITEGVVKAL